MPLKNPAQRLSDIIDNVDAIAAFTAGLDFQAFRVERKTVYAVVRPLEIISEASRRLPDKLLHRHPEIDWAAVAASPLAAADMVAAAGRQVETGLPGVSRSGQRRYCHGCLKSPRRSWPKTSERQ